MGREKPLIYEINTWVWLDTLSRAYRQPVTLASVPDEALDGLAGLGAEAIWLMGVWQRSAAARRSALNYMHEYRPALPDVTEEDVIGSAYAIGGYRVAERLGGPAGLAALRERLRARGLRLILDFVPNHVAADHPWITEQSDYFVRGNSREFKQRHGMFFTTQDAWGRTLYVAHGRDPYFPAWIDTAQLNAFSVAYREGARATLLDIAAQCDGVRCDMAMLLVNQVFDNTWGDFIEETTPETEFWVEITSGVKAQHPDFCFIAEVYWGLEGMLLGQGFDFAYDKTLYDRIGEGNIPKLRDHLRADVAFQKRTLRFIENHDEPRAAASFGVPKSRAAAALVCTLPGAALLHDGQLSGRQVKLPVQIRRAPDEPPNRQLETFYQALLAEAQAPIYRQGEWRLFDVGRTSESDKTAVNLLAYGWRMAASPDAERRLIVINLTGQWAQGLVRLEAWEELAVEDWCLYEALDDVYYYRTGKDMNGNGLFVGLKPYAAQIFHFERVDRERAETNRCEVEQTARNGT